MRADQRSPRWRTELLGLVAAAVLGLGACSAADNAGSGPTPPTSTAATRVSAAAGPAAAASSPAPHPNAGVATTSTSASATGGPPLAALVPPPAAPLVLPAAAPVSLTIPAIDVTSALSTLGRSPDGTVEVPSLEDPEAGAGWFRDSPTPGTLGPSVILGHVDSRQFGPGVFYDLRDLQPGDTVEINRADGTVAVFAVDGVETVPKTSFPTLKVYGNIDHAGLRLITCGGDFDESARGYDDNVIAFATLVSSR